MTPLLYSKVTKLIQIQMVRPRSCGGVQYVNLGLNHCRQARSSVTKFILIALQFLRVMLESQSMSEMFGNPDQGSILGVNVTSHQSHICECAHTNTYTRACGHTHAKTHICKTNKVIYTISTEMKFTFTGFNQRITNFKLKTVQHSPLS